MIRQKLCIAILGIAVTLSVNTDALAKAEYMVPTGATNCAACHLDNFGNGYKAGLILASASPLGKFQGLIAWLNPTVPSVNDTKPILHALDNEWNVTIGEMELVMPLYFSDAEDDSFTLQGSVPTGMTPVPVSIDAQTNLSMASLRWQPTAAQANKTYTVTVFAKESGTGRTLNSDTLTTIVRVWPARTSIDRNVSQFIVRQAQWNNNQLLLAGKLVFKSTITATQRTAALAHLKMTIKTESGITMSVPLKLTPDINGNWTQILNLTETQVPCTVRLDYEGFTATRTVKIAPATCLK